MEKVLELIGMPSVLKNELGNELGNEYNTGNGLLYEPTRPYLSSNKFKPCEAANESRFVKHYYNRIQFPVN